jgi:chemotaxis protein methyltransferase CheR
VTIYFAKPTTRGVIATFHSTLRPDGHLLLGHAETLWQVSDAFDLLPIGEAFVYRVSPTAPTASTGSMTATGAAHDGRPAVTVLPTAERTRQTRRPRLRRPGRRRDLPVVIAAATTPDAREPDSLVAARAAPTRALEAAEAALLAGQYDEAMRTAQRAIDLDALTIPAYAVAGRAAVALGDDDAALSPLRKAVFLEPGCAEAHFTLAGVLARAGQHSAAAASYRAAANAVPTTEERRLARMLDGRDPLSLVDLCEQLAAGADRAADAAASATAAGGA